VSDTEVRWRGRMLRLQARGIRPCLAEAREGLQRRLPGVKPLRYVRPPFAPADSLAFERTVTVQQEGLSIEDSFSGGLAGKTVLFSVRCFPGVAFRVRGLNHKSSHTAWTSDGRQTLEIFELEARTAEVKYVCEIGLR
jgi:hypothetical protein